MSLMEIQSELQRITELTTPEGIREGAAELLSIVNAEVEAYEEWNAREAMAEEAWAMNGQQLVADLCGVEVPF